MENTQMYRIQMRCTEYTRYIKIHEIFNVQCFITFNDRNKSLLCKTYFSESIADICPDVYASRIISKVFSTRKYFIYKVQQKDNNGWICTSSTEALAFCSRVNPSPIDERVASIRSRRLTECVNVSKAIFVSSYSLASRFANHSTKI